MRRLLSRILAVCCLSLALTAAPAVAQGSSPFAPLPTPAPTTDTTTTTTTTSTSSSDDGLRRWQEILIFLAGVALIAGIGFAIVKDARKVAPVTEGELEGGHERSAAGARKAQSKAKARKKGKAQRQARRHNR